MKFKVQITAVDEDDYLVDVQEAVRYFFEAEFELPNLDIDTCTAVINDQGVIEVEITPMLTDDEKESDEEESDDD